MVMFCPNAKHYSDREPTSIRHEQADSISHIIANELGIDDKKGRPGWYWGQNSLDANGLPTVKDYFLRKTHCASFILEPGYIDNNGFAETWLVANRHEELAKASVSAILEVFK